MGRRRSNYNENKKKERKINALLLTFLVCVTPAGAFAYTERGRLAFGI